MDKCARAQLGGRHNAGERPQNDPRELPTPTHPLQTGGTFVIDYLADP